MVGTSYAESIKLTNQLSTTIILDNRPTRVYPPRVLGALILILFILKILGIV
ncbi:hypothetical protein HanPSC8_Chr10g0422971 [Helianthus annuus]|nr:hypothetical protein HanPSC8_Chr10g0422971 [Helianthus annuus]